MPRDAPNETITVWVKLSCRLDRNFKSVRHFALPADGGTLAAAALFTLLQDGSGVDVQVTPIRMYRVQTTQAAGLVPLVAEEQSALCGDCFPLSAPITNALDGAFFIVDVAAPRGTSACAPSLGREKSLFCNCPLEFVVRISQTQSRGSCKRFVQCFQCFRRFRVWIRLPRAKTTATAVTTAVTTAVPRAVTTAATTHPAKSSRTRLRLRLN